MDRDVLYSRGQSTISNDVRAGQSSLRGLNPSRHYYTIRKRCHCTLITNYD